MNKAVYHAAIATMAASLACSAYKSQVFGEHLAAYQIIRGCGFAALLVLVVSAVSTSLTNTHALVSALFTAFCILFSVEPTPLAFGAPLAIALASARMVDDEAARRPLRTAAISILAANALLIASMFLQQGPVGLLLSAGEVGMSDQNYISAAIFSTILLGIAEPTRASKFIVGIAFFILVVLQSRTGLVATILVLLFVASLRGKMVILMGVMLASPWLAHLFFEKYQSSGFLDAISGRLGPWSYYIGEFVDSARYLFPEVVRSEYSGRFFSPETGLYHQPHNIFLNFILFHGWFLGVPVIAIMLVSLLSGRGPARVCLLGSLIYGFFEPTIWFVDSLPGFVFIYGLTGSVRDILESNFAKDGPSAVT
jgi:hypothetical protein